MNATLAAILRSSACAYVNAHYEVRTHHTNVDTYERIREQDLKQNVIVLAWIAYNASVSDQKFPRPEHRTRRQP